MITEERLKELIEQGATIYKLEGNIVLDYNIFDNPDIRPAYKINNQKLIFAIGTIMSELQDLYETKEDAEFALQYKRVPHTEYLDLPTWEEFKNEYCSQYKLKRFRFYSKTHNRIGIYYSRYDGSDMINIRDFDLDESLFYEGLTKENYLKACELCKKLFLGEKL